MIYENWLLQRGDDVSIIIAKNHKSRQALLAESMKEKIVFEIGLRKLTVAKWRRYCYNSKKEPGKTLDVSGRKHSKMRFLWNGRGEMLEKIGCRKMETVSRPPENDPVFKGILKFSCCTGALRSSDK